MRVETTQVQEALECLNAQAPSATQALSEVSGHAAHSTIVAQERFRKVVTRAYCPGTGQLRSMVTGRMHLDEGIKVKVGHVVSQLAQQNDVLLSRLRIPTYLDENRLKELEESIELNEAEVARNGVLWEEAIENAYTSDRIAVLPESLSNGRTTFALHVLREDLLSKEVRPGVTFRDLDGVPWDHTFADEEKPRPLKRGFCAHAVGAFTNKKRGLCLLRPHIAERWEHFRAKVLDCSGEPEV